MAIGLSLFFLAAGAILTFAVTYEFIGIDVTAIGIILMIVAGIGLLLSLLFWSTASPLRRSRELHDEPPPRY